MPKHDIGKLLQQRGVPAVVVCILAARVTYATRLSRWEFFHLPVRATRWQKACISSTEVRASHHWAAILGRPAEPAQRKIV